MNLLKNPCKCEMRQAFNAKHANVLQFTFIRTHRMTRTQNDIKNLTNEQQHTKKTTTTANTKVK